MPNFNHVVEAEYKPTFRTEKVVGMFDVPASKKLRKEWQINMPIEDKDWQIGLIVGASGAGKTTIAKRVFGDDVYHEGYRWASSSLILMRVYLRQILQIHYHTLDFLHHQLGCCLTARYLTVKSFVAN